MSYARQERRSLCDCLALVRPSRGEAEVVRVTDLSLHGVGVRTYKDLELGSRVTVILETAPPTALDAEVAWSRQEGGPMWRAGLRVSHRSEAAMTQLLRVLSTLAPEPPTQPRYIASANALR